MLTNRILDFNPEFYTIWNYRRLILLEGLFIDAYVGDEESDILEN
jgi:geranylgeranyl transferase type-2 subunit alpha